MRLILLVIIFMIAITATSFRSSPVWAQPVVIISPSCGPSSPGFNIVVEASGFQPNTSIGWKLVNSQGVATLLGYFESGDTGGFRDVTFADNLPADTYKMYFGTDANQDYNIDAGSPTTYVDLRVPCPSVTTSNSNSQDWSRTCQTIQKYLINDCSVYVDANGVLTQEGNRARDCILGGGLLSGAGLLSNLPPLVIIGTLERLSEAANCGRIVDWQSLKNDVGGASVFLRILGIV